jgi:hypothetical protein
MNSNLWRWPASCIDWSWTTVVDPLHFYDPAFHSDPDPAFQFDADPDLVLINSSTVGKTLQGYNASLHGSRMSIYAPLWASKASSFLLDASPLPPGSGFDLDADQDPPFHFDPNPASQKRCGSGSAPLAWLIIVNFTCSELISLQRTTIQFTNYAVLILLFYHFH